MDINAASNDMLKEFDREVKADKTIRSIVARVEKKRSSFPEVTKMASRSGSIAGGIIRKKIEEIYENRCFSESEVRALVSPILRHTYDFLKPYLEKVQNAQNERAGIGLKAVIPEYDTGRESGIITEIVNWSIENELTEQD